MATVYSVITDDDRLERVLVRAGGTSPASKLSS